MRVAFLGLGTMGGPMAGHLVAAGHTVIAYNRTPARAEAWSAEHGGATAPTPADAVRGAALVAVCVGADDDVREVVLGPDGALGAMDPGSVLVDHTTASAELARELADRAAPRGVDVLDAPVSGGQSGAEAGRLSVMVGGDPQVLERARPALDAYAARITLVGPTGSGQLTKMVNQILCAAAITGAAEALAFALAAGLDTDAVLDAVTSGAANSWYLEHRGHTMVADEFDFGFAVDWIRKDLGLCLAEARRLGSPLPLVERAEAEYAELQRRGMGRLDATALIRLYRERG